MKILFLALALPLFAAELFPELGPLPPVASPPDNPITEAKVELGKLLFFDTRTSGDGSTSCASCHAPRYGWGDGFRLSRGYPHAEHWRNSQTILNSAYYLKLFWGGESKSLEAQADSAITGNLAGNGDPMMIEERLAQAPDYVRRFKEVFGTPKPLYGDVLKAIAAFERAVPISINVPFDRYARGDKSAMGPPAVRGLALFTGKAGCVRCHNGPLFSDQDYHALWPPDPPDFKENVLRQVALRYQHFARGVPEDVYRHAATDLGLYYTTKRKGDKGRFRTPSLRELKYTAPYMHNGGLATLREVVEFYDRGAGNGANKSPRLEPLRLSAAQKADLLAFLEALSGDEIIVETPPEPPYEKTTRR